MERKSRMDRWRGKEAYKDVTKDRFGSHLWFLQEGA